MKQRISRRRALWLTGAGVGSVAGAAILAACGESAPEAPEATAAPASAVQAAEVTAVATPRSAVQEATPTQQSVQISFATDHVSGSRGKAMQQGMADFASRFPNIPVRFVPIGGDYHDTLSIQFAAGSLDDVVLWSGQLLYAWIDADGYLLLNPLMEKSGLSPSDFVPWNNIWTDGDDWWAFPFQGNITGTVYNISMFDTAGVERPQSGDNYDVMLENARRLTDEDAGTFGVWVRDHPMWWGPYMFSDGVASWRDGRSTLINSDVAKESYQWSVDIVVKEKVSFDPGSRQSFAADFGDPFSTGKLGMNPGTVARATGSLVGRIKDRFSWAVMPEPVSARTNERRHGVNGQSHIITTGSERRGRAEQAWELVKYLSTDFALQFVAIPAARGNLITYMPAFDDPVYRAPPPEGMELLKEYVNTPGPQDHQFFDNWAEWNSVLRQNTQLPFRDEQDPGEALDMAVAACDTVLAAGTRFPKTDNV